MGVDAGCNPELGGGMTMTEVEGELLVPGREKVHSRLKEREVGGVPSSFRLPSCPELRAWKAPRLLGRSFPRAALSGTSNPLYMHLKL